MDMLVWRSILTWPRHRRHVGGSPSVMAALSRPNVFIKYRRRRRPARYPATHQRRNQRQRNTALWDSRYRQLWRLTLRAFEARVAQAKPVKTVASVASFFVSRIDALVDPLLEKLNCTSGEHGTLAK